MISSWFGRGGVKGWTAVESRLEGLYGVTVLAPREPGGRPAVVSCGSLPDATLSAETLAELAKKIATPGCPWTLTLKRNEYKMLVVQEPQVLAAEIEQSLRWSISTMIDYPAEEANLSHVKIPTAEYLPNRTPHVYVVSAHNALINQYTLMFQRARQDLQAVDVREMAQRNIAALASEQGSGLGLLRVGRQGVQFIITFNGELYLDRYVEEFLIDKTDPDQRARSFERVALQVQRSLDFIGRTMPFINVDTVKVAPMPVEIGLVDYMMQNLPVAIETLDLASIFDISATPELEREENQALYFTPLGAALRFVKKTA